MNKNNLLKCLLPVLAVTVWSPVLAGNVNLADARRAASDFIRQQSKVSSTFRAARSLAATDLTLAHAEASQAVAGANDYYAFNVPSGGWVVVAGEDRATAVLAYNDQGSLDFENLPCTFKALLDGYKQEIEYLQAYTGNDLVQASRPAGLKEFTVGPLISSTWGQEAPYDWQCPVYQGEYCVVGCVATAMAQVMNFWEYPESCDGVASYYCYDISKTLPALPATTFNYKLILDSYCHWDWDNSVLVQDTYTDAQAQEVAKLSRYCGQAVEMGYSPEGSGAYTWNQEQAMKDFGFRSTLELLSRSGSYWGSGGYTTAEWETMIKDEINAGRPILYSASDNNGGGGHAFICDGYNWDSMLEAALEAEDDSLTAVKSADGTKTIGVQWKSGNAPRQFTLKTGIYTFREFGAPAGYGYCEDIEFTVVDENTVKVNGKAVKDNTVVMKDDYVTVSFNKTDLTGENEVTGAVIKITNSERTETEWNDIIDKTNDERVKLLDDGKGITWTSDGTTVQIKGLKDSESYVLNESADGKITDGTDEYDVIGSEVTFKIDTTAKNAVTVTSAHKTEVDSEAEEGYIISGENVITICDAKKKAVETELNVGKYDITGETEVEKATLTITDKGTTTDWSNVSIKDADDADVSFEKIMDETDSEKQIGIKWVSGKSDVKITGLKNGNEYVLKETAGENSTFQSNGKTYTVITSELNFKIEDGKAVVGAQDSLATEANPKADNGYFLFDSDANTIKVCDAETSGTATISKYEVGKTHRRTAQRNHPYKSRR